MNITYCDKQCPIGKVASEICLSRNNSAISAAFDFRSFTENCYNECLFKSAHRDKVDET